MPKATPKPLTGATVLYYTGSGAIEGVPAADLSDAAVARIAWIAGGQKDTPADTDYSQTVTDLVGSGLYSTKPPKETTSE